MIEQEQHSLVPLGKPRGDGAPCHVAELLTRIQVEEAYRGTSPVRNTPLLGPYSKTIPRVLWWSYGGGLFLMGEVPL